MGKERNPKTPSLKNATIVKANRETGMCKKKDKETLCVQVCSLGDGLAANPRDRIAAYNCIRNPAVRFSAVGFWSR